MRDDISVDALVSDLINQQYPICVRLHLMSLSLAEVFLWMQFAPCAAHCVHTMVLYK